ncbi:hypothetical protein K1719_046671 [Acacia pycnantha]|nr:hypothetical protein K1719_046669 [Acacia pycnantha]KAI9071371.1 hypothetical protein K1719_046671 [Acacia pycnantha]
MFSTGAFDMSLHKIEAWLLFLPGHQRNKSSVNSLEVEVLHSFCLIVISFLCDAVSMVGNNFGMSLRVIFTVWKVLEVEAEFLSALLNKQLTERLGGCDENEEVTEELLALCAEHVTATCALFHAFELWPQMFYAGLDMPVSDNNAAPAGINCNQLYNTTDADAAAFSLLLKQMPFHLLFPATMCMNGPYSSELSKMRELL